MTTSKHTGIVRGTGILNHTEPLLHTGIHRTSGGATFQQVFDDVDNLYVDTSVKGEFWVTHDGSGNPGEYYKSTGKIEAIDDLVQTVTGRRSTGTNYNLSQTTEANKLWATNNGTQWGMKAKATGDVVLTANLVTADRVPTPCVLFFSGYNSTPIRTAVGALMIASSSTNAMGIRRDDNLGSNFGIPYGLYLHNGTALSGAALPVNSRYYVYAIFDGVNSSLDVNGTIVSGNTGTTVSSVLRVSACNHSGATSQWCEASIDTMGIISAADADKTKILALMNYGL